MNALLQSGITAECHSELLYYPPVLYGIYGMGFVWAKITNFNVYKKCNNTLYSLSNIKFNMIAVIELIHYS